MLGGYFQETSYTQIHAAYICTVEYMAMHPSRGGKAITCLFFMSLDWPLFILIYWKRVRCHGGPKQKEFG